MMRTLVHLSDLHFGRADDRIVRALADCIRQTRPDLIAISGDLTQRARRSQFKEARAFLDALPQPQVVVPGNHDVPLYNVAARFLNPLGGYRRHITADLAPVYTDEEVVVLGANTTRSFTVKGGRFRNRDIERICAALSRARPGAIKVVVAHHPFDVPHAVERLTRCGTDVLLTGHLHVSYAGHTAARYKCGGRSAIVVEAGTATSTRGRGEANAFNVLQLDRSRIVVEQCRWEAASAAFVKVAADAFAHAGDGWRPADGPLSQA